MQEKSTGLHWVPDGIDGWRWELRSASSPHNYEGKVLRYSVDWIEAWHPTTNTAHRFVSMRAAARWLVGEVTR